MTNHKLLAACDRLLAACAEVEEKSDGHPPEAFKEMHDAARALYFRVAGERVVSALEDLP